MFNFSQVHKAHIAPFLAFMLLLGANESMLWLFKGHTAFLLASPQYWIYPLQTLLCGGLLAWYWRYYEFGRFTKISFTLLIAALVLIIWIAPQEIFKMPVRRTGFDPTIFQNDHPIFFATITLRFLRLVIVVPLLEEIFWRGFLMRDLISEDFAKVPFGSFSRFSFAAVTILFGMAHWGPDFWPAIITGALYNLVAIRTKSLACCVISHAVTNLLLGIYIMQTKQWGFW